jgi:hypothetical protein
VRLLSDRVRLALNASFIAQATEPTGVTSWWARSFSAHRFALAAAAKESLMSHAHAAPVTAPTLRPTAARLRIGLVGGPTRAAQQLERVARDLGYQLEHHTGDTAGRGAPTLETLVRRVDVLLICTDLNSHNGVGACRRLAHAYGRPHLLLRRCGPARLAEILADLTAGKPLASVTP